MVIRNTRPLMRHDNVAILNAIRHDASTDFQRRVPLATAATVKETLFNMANYAPDRNEFIHALVNKIGMNIYRSNSWQNPLSEFKIGELQFGDTIEEVLVGLIKAKTYDPHRDALERELFGAEEPDVRAFYHKVNRRDYYKLTVNQALLRQAFQAPDGLSTFITQLMEAPATSDNWDEFLLMTSLFKTYEEANGFFKIQVPDVRDLDSNGEDSRFALRRMRESADTLPFISTHYNAAGMPMAVNRDDLILFTTPEFQAAVDVEALAGAFNIEKAQMASRTIVVPQEHLNIPNGQAVLTTKDFFVVADQLMETREVENAVGLHTNYFLHHWQVISASLAAPAILFTTDEGTDIQREVIDLSSVEVGSGDNGVYDYDGNKVTNLIRGHNYDVRYSPTPNNASNPAVIMTLAGQSHPATYILNTGTLTVSIHEASESLTVQIVSTEDGTITDSVTLPVVGDLAVLWPDPHVVPDGDNDGLREATPAVLTKDEATDTVVIPSITGVQYKKAGVNVNNGSSHVITAPTAFTAEARTGYELTTGSPTSWNFTA